MSQANLFSSLKLRDVAFANRIGVSPMCQYSSVDGMATDWHLVHLGSRASGGAGMVMTEAAAILAEGRISPADLGIWKDAHIDPLARCVHFIKEQGSVAAIQLAHAGRKASVAVPWQGHKAVDASAGGWRPVWGPSELAFSPDYATPEEMTSQKIRDVIFAFAQAAHRSLEAGFQVVELHAAHGYLLHQFLSPLTNQRTDSYGGSFENRVRLTREVVVAVRAVWPERLPLFIRISATDWAEGGWDLEQSVELCRQLKPLGVDLVDCSTGGLLPNVKIPVAPGYQIPFAERIKREAGIPTSAVGLIREPKQADAIIRENQADLVLLGREFLRDPYWPQRAAREFGHPVPHPIQYARAQ